MTLQQVIDDVNAVPEVLEVQSNTTGQHFSYSITKIEYIYQVSDGRLLDGSFVVLEKNDEAFFYKSIPAILRENVIPRSYHMSESEIKTYLEENNIEWTVLSVNISQRGSLDLITTSVDDGNIISEKQYKTYLTQEPEDWVQPEGTHDAYGDGDIVFHKNLYWISNNASNVWEPDGDGIDDSIWEQISKSSFTEIKPVQ